MLVNKSVVCHRIHHGSLGEEEEGHEIVRDVSLVPSGSAATLEEGSPSAPGTVTFLAFGK